MNGYVVSTPSGRVGIGTRLLHLGDVVMLARALGRDVIVDWRDTVFLEDTSLNYFTEFFEPVPELLGVPIHYAPSPATSEYDALPKAERVMDDPTVLAQAISGSGPSPRYLLSRKPPPIHTLPSFDKGTYYPRLRDIYREIVPRPEVAAEVETWYDANLQGHFVVAVNVATGNGLFAKDARFPDFVDTALLGQEERFLRVITTACERATQGLPNAERDRCKIFYATDSMQMSGLLGRLPRAVTRRSVFPPPGAGRYFTGYSALGYSDHLAASDTIIDMLLLARCDALVMNRSRFSRYARVMTDSFGGNVRDFEPIAAE